MKTKSCSSAGTNLLFGTFARHLMTLSGLRLDGVYYVDPRPDMLVNERLREPRFDFQKFLTEDLWTLSK